MQWLESLLVAEAAAGFVLAAMNCRELTRYALAARSAARRAGASALALVCGALALESLTFLAEPALADAPRLREVSLLALRSALLAASAALSALLLRAGRWRA